MNFENPNAQDAVYESGVDKGIESTIEKLRSRGLEMVEKYRRSKKAAAFALATLAASTAYAQESRSPGVYESGIDPSVVETLGSDESRFAAERANIDPDSYFFEDGESSMQRAIELAQKLGIDTNEEEITILFVGNVPVKVNGVSTIDQLTTDELLQVHGYNEMAEIMEQHTSHVDQSGNTGLSQAERAAVEEALEQATNRAAGPQSNQEELTPEERAAQPLQRVNEQDESTDDENFSPTKGRDGMVFESKPINPDAY